MRCNSTPPHCSSQHPGHRAGLPSNRLLNPGGVCVRACVARWCLFAHHSANQPQRQQLRGAALRTWAEEAVTLSQRSANTELSVLNRDRRASTGSLSHCVMFKSVISQTTSADNLILCSMAGREPAPGSFPLNKRDNIKEYQKKNLRL